MGQGILKKLILKTGMVQRLANYITHYQKEKLKLNKVLEHTSNAIIGNGCNIDTLTTIRNNQSDKNKITIGTHTTINASDLLVYRHGGEIIIGNYCFIGPGSRLWSAKKISIGNRVLISHNVNIQDNNSHPMNAAERHADFKHITVHGLPATANYNEKEISIGDDVWIGFNATILKGITIGKCAVIGACSVVTQSVPDYAVVAGNPATIIKHTS